MLQAELDRISRGVAAAHALACTNPESCVSDITGTHSDLDALVVDIDGVGYFDCPFHGEMIRRDWHRCEFFGEFWPKNVHAALNVAEYMIDRWEERNEALA